MRRMHWCLSCNVDEVLDQLISLEDQSRLWNGCGQQKPAEPKLGMLWNVLGVDSRGWDPPGENNAVVARLQPKLVRLGNGLGLDIRCWDMPGEKSTGPLMSFRGYR